MVSFGGTGGMAMSARFKVDADLSPFQAQINEAVQNALVRFGVLKEKVNGNFESTMTGFTARGEKKRDTENNKNEALLAGFEQKSDLLRTQVHASGKMMLRRLMSESMQSFNIINQVTGWSKNQTYQLVSGLISGVVGLISSIGLSMSMAIPTYGPILGPILIAWNAGNAITAFSLQTMLQITQAQIANTNNDIGNIFFGDDY